MSYALLYFKLVRYLLPLLNTGLGLLLGYQLSMAILTYARPLPHLNNALITLPNLAASGAVPGMPAADVNRIIAAQLFGQAARQQTQQVQAPPPTEAPETKLNVKLQGVLYSDTPQSARAFIRLDDGKSVVLGVGDSLGKQANAPQVDAIYANKVIILRNGRQETLPLAGTDSNQQQLIQYTPTQTSDTPPSHSGSTKLAEYRQQILQNPGNLAQYIRMQPAQQNGQFIGYILRPGREAGLLEEFGLQAGDIVTAVNGIVLDSPFKMDVLQQLTQATSVNLQILRNGSTLSMNLSATP